MPFKDDRRTPTGAQWLATALCGALVGGLIFLLSRQTVPPSPPQELRLPARRPAVQTVPAPKPTPVSPVKSAPKPGPPAPQPNIRVNLTATPQSTLKISISGGYAVRKLNGDRLLEGKSLASSEVRMAAGGLSWGKSSLGKQPVEIVPGANSRITVNQHSYHGSVRIYPQSSGRLTAVNVLPLEAYIACVVDAEMPAKFAPAAREAQAIVARTYALWQMQQADTDAKYDVFATVRSQKYLGVDYIDGKGRKLAGESASSRQAAANTRGLVCTSKGQLFCTYYSAVCGGATTPGTAIFSDAHAALRSVPCEWCKASDKYRWQSEFSSEELLTALKKIPAARKLTAVRSIRQTAGPHAGVIAEFELSDGRQTATVTGMSLREQLPPGKLLSPHFSLQLSGRKITAQGSGFGHGAGLCQWGASGLAESGKSAREIVQHYYPGAQVTARGY